MFISDSGSFRQKRRRGTEKLRNNFFFSKSVFFLFNAEASPIIKISSWKRDFGKLFFSVSQISHFFYYQVILNILDLKKLTRRTSVVFNLKHQQQLEDRKPNLHHFFGFYYLTKTTQSWVIWDFCWIQLKRKVTVENEFFSFENKISLKTRTNLSFLIFHDHEGAGDLNVLVCLCALMHENGIFCSLLLTTSFVPLLSSSDIKSQSHIKLPKCSTILSFIRMLTPLSTHSERDLREHLRFCP